MLVTIRGLVVVIVVVTFPCQTGIGLSDRQIGKGKTATSEMTAIRRLWPCNRDDVMMMIHFCAAAASAAQVIHQQLASDLQAHPEQITSHFPALSRLSYST